MASPMLDETFCIPAEARDLEGFRMWARSARFPERGRLDYLGGDIEVDMSPEDLYTHGSLKMEVAALLHALVTKSGEEPLASRAPGAGRRRGGGTEDAGVTMPSRQVARTY